MNTPVEAQESAGKVNPAVTSTRTQTSQSIVGLACIQKRQRSWRHWSADPSNGQYHATWVERAVLGASSGSVSHFLTASSCYQWLIFVGCLEQNGCAHRSLWLTVAIGQRCTCRWFALTSAISEHHRKAPASNCRFASRALSANRMPLFCD